MVSVENSSKTQFTGHLLTNPKLDSNPGSGPSQQIVSYKALDHPVIGYFPANVISCPKPDSNPGSDASQQIVSYKALDHPVIGYFPANVISCP